MAVEFVDGAVGFKAERVFFDACAAYESCGAGVAGAGVDNAFFHGCKPTYFSVSKQGARRLFAFAGAFFGCFPPGDGGWKA